MYTAFVMRPIHADYESMKKIKIFILNQNARIFIYGTLN